ncbi:winged helix-turn-helix transcriptional regulator [Pontibacter sp. JH31]|uniref:Winged helix-turn-helix transcriptional regulator n=1 Tax=Pontibacter aquaedesilientis TaxID=2766980 RepID=A0ABR7XKQ4_9BACT|nr:metalloregulator ArsR/SmtB family transcription factor [Pontibacter aquaedesilientis]MBD1398868.1 winged helix-turn-helix transcriptional regulator [Pontibacter aquaedesilientis]
MEINCIRDKADESQIRRCRERLKELNDSFFELSQGLELASNNVRLKILFLLYEESRLCVCDLSDVLGMNISAVSQHLRKLKDRDLIILSKAGKIIFYSLTPKYEQMLKPFFKLLEENKIFNLV